MELTLTENGALFALQHGAGKEHRNAHANLANARKIIRTANRALEIWTVRNPNRTHMFHLIWYLIVGLIAGLVAKSAMHTHLTLLWTVVLGIVGSLVGGFVTHLFIRPRGGSSFHPAGIVFSILGALLVLFLWTKLNLHLPAR